MANYCKRKKNAVFINPANSLKHETEKLKLCYNLRKEKKEFITEAVENKTGLRRDVVCLDTGIVYELETNPKKAKSLKREGYLNDNVEVIEVK